MCKPGTYSGSADSSANDLLISVGIRVSFRETGMPLHDTGFSRLYVGVIFLKKYNQNPKNQIRSINSFATSA